MLLSVQTTTLTARTARSVPVAPPRLRAADGRPEKAIPRDGAGPAEALARDPWSIAPAPGWRRKPTAGPRHPGLAMLGFALAATLAGVGLAAVWLAYAPGAAPAATLSALLTVAFGLLGIGAWLVRRDLLVPLAHLRNWATRIRAGNLAVRIPEPQHGEFAKLAKDINALSDTLQTLSRDLDEAVRRQTERIEQKTRSLKILYDVAASVNVSRDLDDLLTRFLHTLREVVDARAATVRLLDASGQMRLVASVGLDPSVEERERFIPASDCLCGNAADAHTVLCSESIEHCRRHLGETLFGDERLSLLAVPLQYRGRTLGVYNLFVDRDTLRGREDLEALLTSIGRHLGMAIEKARLDEEAQRLSIMEERTRLAHELHDSLAQTLASLRFQIRVLDETLHEGKEADLWHELERIENSVDEAYVELRELIAHFRAPVDRRGLLAGVERLVERARREMGIPVFFQKEWREDERLPAVAEMEVLRIVQEALANARKHSRAQHIRVLLQARDGTYRVLVEDDGVGFDQPPQGGHRGEHLGLSIMRDRARRLGGKLRIESEPGEGTRVHLTFTRAGLEGSGLRGALE